MPYSGPDDTTLPEHVMAMPEDMRRQWIAVFQDTLERTGDEGEAMRQANAAAPDPARIKASTIGDDWTLDVLSAPYGGPENGRDRHGEYFSLRTNFYETEGAPLPLVAYYHGYTPDGQPQGEPEIIGRAIKTWRNAQGLWHRVVLDKSKQLAHRVWEAAQRGTARASTGIAGYMGRTNRDGEITHWLIGELSIWDADGSRQPANQYAVARPAVKALLEQAGFNLDSLDAATGDEQEPAAEPGDIHDDELPPQEEVISMAEETITMADVEKMVNDRLAAERQALADAEATRQADAQRIEAAITAERAKWDAEAAAARRLPDSLPHVAKFGNLWAYDNLDGGDLSVMIGVLQSAQKKVSENALKALAIRATQEENGAQMMRTRAVMQQLGMPLKANELNQSTLASYGDEWIGITYSTQMWDKIRMETPVIGNLPTIEVPPGSESIVIPLASTAPTFYKVAQASAQDTNTLGKATYTVTSSKQGTDNETLTVAKLGARTIYTGELEEDSLIPWAAELRRDLEQEGAEVLESCVIDGDTDLTINTNINFKTGTPTTQYWTLFNGLRKLALITNTANSRSAGALSIEDFLETVKLMGIAGKNALNKAGVAFIIDLWTHWKSLELPEVKTRDVYAQPTIENGNLTGLFGYPVIPTANMHRANQDTTYGLKTLATGLIDNTTAANNLYGAILAVRWDQWRLGWKRRMTFETQRIIQADATDIVLMMRVGLLNRDTEASAISYGVTV